MYLCAIFLLIFNTEIIFCTICTYVYIFIHISIDKSIFLYNNFYVIATCFHKKIAMRSPVCMYGYHVRAFESSLVIYIERDVLRTISNDVILVHFQQMKNKLFSLQFWLLQLFLV